MQLPMIKLQMQLEAESLKKAWRLMVMEHVNALVFAMILIKLRM